MLSSAGDVAIGVLVESSVAFGVGGLLYRVFAGRFLIPKRETVLPYYRAVLIRNRGEMKVVEAGRHWVRPGEKLITCDARPRTLQMEGYQVLSADGVVMRLCLSGEYQLIDPVRYLAASTNAADKLHAQVRRSLSLLCRQWSSTAALGSGATELISQGVLDAMRGSGEQVGLELHSLQVWELVVLGGPLMQTSTDEDLLQ